MKLFLVSFLSFICIYPCFAIKPINCRLDAEIIRIQIDPDDLDPDPFAYKMKANAILHINNRLSDSILLKVDHPVTLPVKGLGIDSIIITTPSKDTLPYNYNGEILTIKIRNEKLIKIEYSVYIPNVFANNMNLNNFLISEYYIYDQRSWFFSSPDMEITSLNVIVPPKSRLIPGRNFLRNGHIYHFVGDDLHKSNMVILAKNKYREVSGSSAGVKYRLWLHNFKDSLNTDTTVRSNFFIDRLKPANSLTRKELCKKKEMVERYLRLATKIFPATLDIKNIVECDWRTENVSGGRCLSSSLILADGSFIMNGGLLHELLHSFDPIDYQSYADSSRFLFSESMIEYLSRYLIRNDRTIKSKNFSLDDPFFEKYPKTPIFKIENNTQDTQYTIYVYVPWVLENFAEEIGEEKFISAYKQFHKNSLQNKSVQFEDFLKILRKFNISEESISNLVNKLNGIN